MPSALKPRFRREMGKSKFALALACVRLRSVSVKPSSSRRSLSRCSVLPPSFTVMLASPAGTANKGPLAVRSTSPDVVRLFDESRPVSSSRSLRVMERAMSPLPVADQRHLPSLPLRAIPTWPLSVALFRTRGSSAKSDRPISERP